MNLILRQRLDSVPGWVARTKNAWSSTRLLLLSTILGAFVFAAGTANGQTEPRPPCWHEEFAALAFLEGEWKVSAEDRVGGHWETNEAHAWINTDMDGCTLVENYRGTREGKRFIGRATYGVNIVTSKLQRVWIDGEHGMFTTFEGSRSGDEIVLEYHMVLRGQPVILRAVYFDISPDAFRFEGRRSNDDGRTWDVSSKHYYTRVPVEASAPLPSVELPPELARVLSDYEAAWQAKDAHSIAALFAEDGFVLSGGQPPVRGRAEIERRYAGSGGPLALRALAWSSDGKTGYIIGAYGPKRGGEDTGKFTLTLKRDESGRWLIMSDMDNSNQRR